MLDEDLNLIFSRFGTILSCEVIRDKRTGDSLQYAFIEFEEQKDCEQAYFKMQGVLIDDHRIHVDFSQSVRAPHHHYCLGQYANISQVSKLSESWRNSTVTKRRERGGFGGVADLEAKRQYRELDDAPVDEDDARYRMMFDKNKNRGAPAPPREPPREAPSDRTRVRRDRGSRSPRRDGRDRYRRRSYSRSPQRDSRRDSRRERGRYDNRERR